MKTQKNVRNITEEDNPLFELMQYKVNIEFISENKNKELYNKYKKIILTQFRYINIEIQNIERNIYFKYKLISNKEQNFIPKYSLNLTEDPNINLKILILLENEEKQKYITSYLNSLTQSKNKNLISYSRLFILNDKYYENYVYNVKNKIPTAKNEAGVIYTPMKESSFNYIYKYTLKQIIQVFNDFGKKQYDIIKSQDIKSLKKENIFKQIEEGILFRDFNYVLNLCNYLENTMNWIPEISLIKEIKGIMLFYQDYFSIEEMVLSQEIKKFFNDVKDIYKKKKDILRECQCLLKICVYNAYFIGNEDSVEKCIQKLLIKASNTQYEFQLLIHLQLIWLYRQIKFNRKINLNNYLGIALCQKFFNEDNKIKNYFNIFMQLLIDNCLFPIYDIYHKKILSNEIFKLIHKNIEKNGWKNVLFQMEEKDKEGKIFLTEATKKKIKKDTIIYVTRFAQNIHFFEYKLKWYNIQECLYRNIINYYKLNHENISELIFYMSYLQALEDDMNEKKQKDIMNEIIKKSLNKKINLSLYKIPILIKIIPKCSDIKFDINQNEKIKKTKQLFLYNPWKKASTINYFWSKNSYQYVIIEFQNVLKIPITINNLIVLFQRKELKQNESSEASDSFNKGKLPKCFPTSITIPPNSISIVSEKILMQDELIFDIVGIKYDILNITTEQYINPDGNGLYFSCENILKDDYYSTIITGKQKLYVNLNDIQIYKEIPRLDIIKVNNIYDNDDELNLYEYQEFLFNFELKNNGNYIIDEIDFFVYIYKKEDYKLCIKEGNIKKVINLGEIYNLEYKYFHLSDYYKIEFRFYLKSEKYEKENEMSEELISPYIFYFKKIKTNTLLNFSFPKIIPQINSNSIEEICKMDKRLPNDYKYIYSFNKKIFSFNASNNRKNKITLEIKDNDSLIKKEIINDEYSKEIEFEINSKNKLNDIKIKWDYDMNIINKLKGEMSIGDIFPNIKNNLLDENYFNFSLDVNKRTNEEYDDEMNIYEINYKIKNNSDKIFNNLKLMCYIYQNITDGTFSLNDDLFYEGSLISFIDNLRPNDSIINKIVLYLDKIYNNYCTTFLLINPDNNTVYMSPINKNLI